MHKKPFSLVLHNPEIPGNTGSIGRTCVALGIELILIKPYGFEISEKSVRRAGLDYWKHLNLKEYSNWESFLDSEKPTRESLFFFSKKASKHIFQAQFHPKSYLIFGSETKGLPGFLREEFPENFVELPMFSSQIRSLNLANTATTAAYECLRQLNL